METNSPSPSPHYTSVFFELWASGFSYWVFKLDSPDSRHPAIFYLILFMNGKSGVSRIVIPPTENAKWNFGEGERDCLPVIRNSNLFDGVLCYIGFHKSNRPYCHALSPLPDAGWKDFTPSSCRKCRCIAWSMNCFRKYWTLYLPACPDIRWIQ